MSDHLATASRCPFDPFSADYLADPYPVLARLRAERPVFLDEALGYYVVTRHADIEAVFRDPELFSAANAQDPVTPLYEEARSVLAGAGFRTLRTMSNADGEHHSRIRRHNQVGFSPRRLRAMEPVVRQSTSALLDAMVAGRATGRADLVAALSYPLPAGIIFALLGFPAQDTDLLKSWAGNRMSFSWGRPTPDEQARIARHMLAYWQYCEAHTARRVAEPADDFTSDLARIHLADPDALSTQEISHVIYGFSFAGHETTTNLISNTVRRLLESGGWEALVSDPSLIPAAVEEGLRFDSSVLMWRRVATAPTELGGVAIPQGAPLLLALGSANRDPEVFADPERFDLHRDDANRHLSFGWGKHYCLGAPLAKLEVATVLGTLCARLPSLRLVADQQLTFHPNTSFRGPQQLWVEWDEAAADVPAGPASVRSALA
jgi:cytochrome P450